MIRSGMLLVDAENVTIINEPLGFTLPLAQIGEITLEDERAKKSLELIREIIYKMQDK